MTIIPLQIHCILLYLNIHLLLEDNDEHQKHLTSKIPITPKTNMNHTLNQIPISKIPATSNKFLIKIQTNFKSHIPKIKYRNRSKMLENADMKERWREKISRSVKKTKYQKPKYSFLDTKL